MLRFLSRTRQQATTRTVLGIGPCNVHGIVRCAAAALDLEPVYIHPHRAASDPDMLVDALGRADVVFASRGKAELQVRDLAARSSAQAHLPVIPTPTFYFPGFHPDVCYPAPAGERPDLPMGNAFSAILLAALREGLTADEAISLFRDDVFDALGYYETFDLACSNLERLFEKVGVDVQPLMKRWMEDAPFVYLPLHPKLRVLNDLAMAQLRLAELHNGTSSAKGLDDELARNLIWPVYPEIAARLGIAGDYVFRPKNMRGVARDGLEPMTLETFVARTYACFEKSPPVFSAFERMNDPRLNGIRRFARQRRRAKASNPYKERSASHWWSEAVAGPSPNEVDPVTRTKFTIGKDDEVATAGSCFAQHLSDRLVKAGFKFLVTEKAPPGCRDPRAADYGLFTARFGNIYTVRQLVQLADRAYGNFHPTIDAWKVANGFVDPFRPRLSDGPFKSLNDLRASRDAHFAAVRTMFEAADVFVFTLGLTEAWKACSDDAVVPLHPGVLDVDLPPDTYVPHNFTVAETIEDLRSLVQLLQRLNPTIRILLTVSPVPLIATHGDDHVLAATTYSKSVLRAAAGEIAKTYSHVAYFPSYEIVTGSFNRGSYFAEDLRQVTKAGVDHVMKVFLRHYAPADGLAEDDRSDARQFRSEAIAASEVICDEEEIGRSRGQP